VVAAFAAILAGSNEEYRMGLHPEFELTSREALSEVGDVDAPSELILASAVLV
jgi:hypothetical protein